MSSLLMLYLLIPVMRNSALLLRHWLARVSVSRLLAVSTLGAALASVTTVPSNQFATAAGASLLLILTETAYKLYLSS